MTDHFNSDHGHESPAYGAFSITPNDSSDLSNYTRGIYVGVSGNLKVTLVSGETVTFVDMASGMVHPLRIKRVYSTDTTASSLIGLY